MIQVNELTRTYEDFIAVDKVSFSIEKGEIVGLLGHNGAGKTTIMKMLTGFLEPTAGSIRIDDLDPLEHPMAVRRKIGYLPENCPVYPEMTVIDYLDYTAALNGVSNNEKAERIRKAVARTALESKATQPVSTLSRGYQQRVGVAQAILHQPEILILDEPTNGLDPTQIQHMRDLIKTLADRSTVILSTHILQEVQAVCSRVMIIRSGQKALDARLEDLQTANRLIVLTDQGPERLQDLLEPLEQLQGMEQLPGADDYNSYGLNFAEGADIRQTSSRVAEAILGGGGHLYELRREQRNLEAVFGEITAAEGRIAS